MKNGRSDYQLFSAEALGLRGVDMTATAGTKYESVPLNLGPFSYFQAHTTINQTGGTVLGSTKLSLQKLSPDGSNLDSEIVLGSGIDTKSDNLSTVRWGREVAASVFGTITVGTEVARATPIGWAKLVIEITAASDSSSSLADVSLEAES